MREGAEAAVAAKALTQVPQPRQGALPTMPGECSWRDHAVKATVAGTQAEAQGQENTATQVQLVAHTSSTEPATAQQSHTALGEQWKTLEAPTSPQTNIHKVKPAARLIAVPMLRYFQTRHSDHAVIPSHSPCMHL